MKRKKIYLSLVLIFILITLILNPSSNMEAFSRGIRVWATNVLPALFPFFLFTKLLCELNIIESFTNYLNPITKKLYNCGGISGYIYLMSIISGYPVGAKLVSDFYKNGIITSGQAHRIITFTSTSGPFFIIGTVGIGMFFNQKAGFIMLISHFISAILNGLIYRKYKNNEKTPEKIYSFNNANNKNLLQDCMLNSIQSILIVGGYVSIFFLLINMINDLHIFNPLLTLITKLFSEQLSNILKAILNGLIEVTHGCLDLSEIGLSIELKTILATALISFGGFSVHMQAYTFLKQSGISYKFFLLQKTTHTIISVIISLLFTRILL